MKSTKLSIKQEQLKKVLKPIVEGILKEANSTTPNWDQIDGGIRKSLIPLQLVKRAIIDGKIKELYSALEQLSDAIHSINEWLDAHEDLSNTK